MLVYNLTDDGLKLKAKRNLEILIKEFEKNETAYLCLSSWTNLCAA